MVICICGVRLAEEKPYHIVTPAMHKSKEDIAQLFHEKFEWEADLTPQEMTQKVRQKLREKFFSAQAGITGANFLIADTGSVALDSGRLSAGAFRARDEGF